MEAELAISCSHVCGQVSDIVICGIEPETASVADHLQKGDNANIHFFHNASGVGRGTKGSLYIHCHNSAINQILWSQVPLC